MNKRWAVREKPDNEDVIKLAAELNIDTVLSTLLITGVLKLTKMPGIFSGPTCATCTILS